MLGQQGEREACTFHSGFPPKGRSCHCLWQESCSDPGTHEAKGLWWNFQISYWLATQLSTPHDADHFQAPYSPLCQRTLETHTHKYKSFSSKTFLVFHVFFFFSKNKNKKQKKNRCSRTSPVYCTFQVSGLLVVKSVFFRWAVRLWCWFEMFSTAAPQGCVVVVMPTATVVSFGVVLMELVEEEQQVWLLYCSNRLPQHSAFPCKWVKFVEMTWAASQELVVWS